MSWSQRTLARLESAVSIAGSYSKKLSPSGKESVPAALLRTLRRFRALQIKIHKLASGRDRRARLHVNRVDAHAQRLQEYALALPVSYQLSRLLPLSDSSSSSMAGKLLGEQNWRKKHASYDASKGLSVCHVLGMGQVLAKLGELLRLMRLLDLCRVS